VSRRSGVERVLRAVRKIAVAGATGRVERHIVGALEVRGYTTLAGPTFEQWLDTALGCPGERQWRGDGGRAPGLGGRDWYLIGSRPRVPSFCR
jgi:hypothetical protein